LAIWAPVTKPTAASPGSPSRSSTHRPAISSTTAAAGDITWTAAFWSAADTIQSAPSATGSDPPVTKPK
jgi:hypothetical protein